MRPDRVIARRGPTSRSRCGRASGRPGGRRAKAQSAERDRQLAVTLATGDSPSPFVQRSFQMKQWIIAALAGCTALAAQAETLSVKVNAVTAQGIGESVGSVKIESSEYGLCFAPS